MQTEAPGWRESEPADSALYVERGRAIEEILHRNRGEEGALLSQLVELSRLLGPLSEGTLELLSRRLGEPVVRLIALAEAYGFLRPREPIPLLGLCTNAGCAARGGLEVERVVREKELPFEALRCQGACDLGPIACYLRGAPLAISAARARALAKADPRDWENLLSVEKPVHAFKTDRQVAFANLFAKGSHQLATARRHGVYAALEGSAPDRALLLAQLEESGLAGEGAMALWRAFAASTGRKVLLVQGLELVPGTAKERLLMERDPHLVVAGACLAAHALGASECLICVRAEYELAFERVRTALEEAQRAGLLGARAQGAGAKLKAMARLLPSVWSFGEPLRLVEALEGELPLSRGAGESLHSGGWQTGFVAQGLFGAPTLVEGLERVVKLPALAAKGADWYGAQGLRPAEREGRGTRLLSLGGDLKRPGTYEVAAGASIRRMVEEYGEGPLQGKSIVALQVGGAGSAFLPPEALDRTFDDESLSGAGAQVGNGALIAITEKSCLFGMAKRELLFFWRQGCGACASCVPGGPFGELMARLEQPESAAESLLDAARQMRGEGCRAAQAAAAPAESLLQHFASSRAEHLRGECVCSPKRRA